MEARQDIQRGIDSPLNGGMELAADGGKPSDKAAGDILPKLFIMNRLPGQHIPSSTPSAHIP